MTAKVKDIHKIGIGEVVLAVFRIANLIDVRDLLTFAYDDKKLLDAVNIVAKERFGENIPRGYIRRLNTRCVNIINSFRYSDTAKSEYPINFVCPITMEVMINPVVAPSGFSYEKEEIEKWVEDNHVDPLTRQPLEVTQLYDNRNLKEAIDYYNLNFQKLRLTFNF